MKSSFFFGIDGTILLFWLIFVVGGFVCTEKVVFVYTEREVDVYLMISEKHNLVV